MNPLSVPPPAGVNDSILFCPHSANNEYGPQLRKVKALYFFSALFLFSLLVFPSSCYSAASARTFLCVYCRERYFVPSVANRVPTMSLYCGVASSWIRSPQFVCARVVITVGSDQSILKNHFASAPEKGNLLSDFIPTCHDIARFNASKLRRRHY